MVRSLQGRYESILQEVDRIIALFISLRKRFSQSCPRAEGQADLVRVCMQKPISVKSCGELLLASQKWLPTVNSIARKSFNSYQTPITVALSESYRSIRRSIVNKVYLQTLTDKVF